MRLTTRREAHSDNRPVRSLARRTAVVASLAWAAAAFGQGHHGNALSAGSTTSVVGVVGDSIHGGPLTGAVIMLDGLTREAVTDSIGRFRIDSVVAGEYRVGVFHPILDSLGTSLATRPVQFNAGKPMLISIATPSGRTLRRAICPEMPSRPSSYERRDSGVVVLVGRVLDPDSNVAVPEATVTLTWVETAFTDTSVHVTSYQRMTTSSDVGDFRFCALPTGVNGLLRVTTAPNGAGVEREISLQSRIVTMATIHVPLARIASAEGSRITAELSGEVQRPDGSPFVGATAFVEGARDTAVTNDTGAFTLQGLPLGTHMVVVRSVGFEPVSEVVELTSRSAQHVSVALTTPATELNPVFVQAHRLAIAYARIGFDQRRQEGVGRFLTADEIAQRHAASFSQLFSGLSGVQPSYTPGGTNLANGRGPDACLIYVIDGAPMTNVLDGELDATIRPDEIAAVEVYSGASVPPEFRVPSAPGRNLTGVRTEGTDGCATIVVWTKTHLGLRTDNASQ